MRRDWTKVSTPIRERRRACWEVASRSRERMLLVLLLLRLLLWLLLASSELLTRAELNRGNYVQWHDPSLAPSFPPSLPPCLPPSPASLHPCISCGDGGGDDGCDEQQEERQRVAVAALKTKLGAIVKASDKQVTRRESENSSLEWGEGFGGGG